MLGMLHVFKTLLHFISLQEQAAFDLLIGNLLDNHQITEARRIASYFERVTIDLDIVQVS